MTAVLLLCVVAAAAQDWVWSCEDCAEGGAVLGGWATTENAIAGQLGVLSDPETGVCSHDEVSQITPGLGTIF